MLTELCDTAPLVVLELKTCEVARRFSQRQTMHFGKKEQLDGSESATSVLAHTMTASDLAAQFNLQPATGATAAEALQRIQQFGPNVLPNAPQRPTWHVFAAQFKSILILILIGASGLSLLLGNFKDAIVILAVVLINATVGFYQEWRAEQSLAALKDMLPLRARVRRQGQKVDIPAADLVPGDVVLLEAGDSVPADGRLWFAAGLEVDESALTGESQPARKQTDGLHAAETVLADRSNMVYMNTPGNARAGGNYCDKYRGRHRDGAVVAGACFNNRGTHSTANPA